MPRNDRCGRPRTEIERSVEVTARAQAYVGAAVSIGDDAMSAELPDRIAARHSVRNRVGLAQRHYPQHELVHAAIYAPLTDPRDDLLLEPDDNRHALLRSKEAVLRFLAQNSDDTPARVAFRSGLTSIVTSINDKAEIISKEAAARLEQLDGDSVVRTESVDQPLINALTSTLMQQIQVHASSRPAALLASGDDGTLTPPEGDLPKRATQEKRLRAAAIDPVEEIPRRRPTVTVGVNTLVTVFERGNHGHDSSASSLPPASVVLPHELFDVQLVDNDALVPLASSSSLRSNSLSAIEQLRSIADLRARRLVDSFKRREGTVRHLLHQLADLRTQVKILTLQRDEIRSRVSTVLVDTGAMTNCTDFETRDVSSMVEEGIDALWSDMRTEFHNEIAVAVKNAQRHAAEAQQAVHAARSAASRSLEETLKVTEDELRRVSAALFETSSRCAVLEEKNVETDQHMATLRAELRHLKTDTATALEREAAAVEDGRRLQALNRELEARIVELRSSKREDDLRALYENALRLKGQEIEQLKTAVSQSKTQAVEAMMQVVTIRKQLSTAEAAAQSSQAEFIRQFVSLVQLCATVTARLIDALGFDNRTAREAVHNAVFDVARGACVALTTVASFLPASEASLALQTVSNLKQLQATATASAADMCRDPMLEVVNDLQALLSRARTELQEERSSAVHRVEDRGARERSNANAFAIQVCQSFCALVDISSRTTASKNMDQLAGMSFPLMKNDATLNVEPLSDAWNHIRTAFYAVKREFINVRSTERTGGNPGLVPKATTPTAPDESPAPLIDVDTNRNAIHASQDMLRSFADMVNKHAIQPLAEVSSAIQAVGELGGPLRDGRGGDEASSVWRVKRCDATRRMFILAIKRAAMAASWHSRLASLHAAAERIEAFVGEQSDGLRNGSVSLRSSKDTDQALDRLARLKIAAEVRLQRQRLRVKGMMISRERAFWNEFAEASHAKMHAVAGELTAMFAAVNDDVTAMRLHVAKLTAVQGTASTKPLHSTSDDAADAAPRVLGEVLMTQEITNDKSVEDQMGDRTCSEVTLHKVESSSAAARAVSAASLLAPKDPSASSVGVDSNDALNMPLAIPKKRPSPTAVMLDPVALQADPARTPTDSSDKPTPNGLMKMRSSSQLGTPLVASASFSPPSTAIAATPTVLERIISPGQRRPQSGAVTGTRAKPVRLHSAIRAAQLLGNQGGD